MNKLIMRDWDEVNAKLQEQIDELDRNLQNLRIILGLQHPSCECGEPLFKQPSGDWHCPTCEQF